KNRAGFRFHSGQILRHCATVGRSRTRGGLRAWSYRDEPTDEVFDAFGPGERHGYRGDRSRCLRWNKRMRRYILGNDDARANHRAFSNAEGLAGRSDEHCVRADVRVFLDHDPARSPSMSEYDCPDADLSAFVNLDAFRVLILQIHVIADENIRCHFDTSPSVQPDANAGRTRKLARQEMEQSVGQPACDRHLGEGDPNVSGW